MTPKLKKYLEHETKANKLISQSDFQSAMGNIGRADILTTRAYKYAAKAENVYNSFSDKDIEAYEEYFTTDYIK